MPTVQTASLPLPLCDIAIAGALDLTPEEFTNSRRQGIGASDTSVILGLQAKWKKPEDVILEKLQTQISEAELEISKKAAVRMGRELEPLVLQKAADWLERDLIKPLDTYRLKEYPWLTVNYDGILEYDDQLVPVEAKCVTKFGEKYYDFDSIDGIPDYYYAQLQHQMLGLGSNVGYLAVLRIDKWDLAMFRIRRDDTMIRRILSETYSVWQRIERGRQRM